MASVSNAGDEPVPPNIQNQPPDNRSAHHHNADGSCCKPCVPTKADEDPDVAKRPCFRHALMKARVLGAAFPWQDSPGKELVGRDDLWLPTIQKCLAYASQVLIPVFQPADADAVQWLGLKPIASAPGQTGVQGTWTAGDYTLMIGGSADFPGFTVTIKVTGAERLPIRPRPPQNEFIRWGDFWKWEYVDKTALHETLTKFFLIPFESIDEFEVHSGPCGSYAGVEIFSAKLWSKAFRERLESGLPASSKLSWYDELNVFLTDSDPQYLCISAELPKEAKTEKQKTADTEP